MPEIAGPLGRILTVGGYVGNERVSQGGRTTESPSQDRRLRDRCSAGAHPGVRADDRLLVVRRSRVGPDLPSPRRALLEPRPRRPGDGCQDDAAVWREVQATDRDGGLAQDGDFGGRPERARRANPMLEALVHQCDQAMPLAIPGRQAETVELNKNVAHVKSNGASRVTRPWLAPSDPGAPIRVCRHPSLERGLELERQRHRYRLCPRPLLHRSSSSAPARTRQHGASRCA
jgi:hypothetical protein